MLTDDDDDEDHNDDDDNDTNYTNDGCRRRVVSSLEWQKCQIQLALTDLRLVDRRSEALKSECRSSLKKNLWIFFSQWFAPCCSLPKQVKAEV